MNKTSSTSKFLTACVGTILMIVLWQIVSLRTHAIVLASPVDTFKAVVRLAGTGRFWSQLWASFQRIVAGIALGGLSGFVLGIAAGLVGTVRYVLEPLRWILMSIPAVVVVVIAMLWFGMGSAMVVFITALLLSPIVYINTVRGFEMVDGDIIEMARIYGFPRGLTVRHIYVPAVAGQVASSLVVATGIGVRIVILAEVMGASEGIGHALSLSRSTLEIPDLYAWVAVCIAIVGFIEYVVLKPIEHRIMRWRT